MLLKRIVSASVFIILIVLAISFDWLCALAVTSFIVIGLYEFYSMLEKKGIKVYKYFGIIMGAAIPLSIMARFETTKSWELIFIVLAMLFLVVMQFKRRQNSGVTVDISTTIFGILYVAWFFSFMVKIRYLDAGLGFMASLLLMTKLGDIGGFLVGTRFGKTPLMPQISPKKTVEGAIGSLVFSVGGALLSSRFLPFNYLHLVLLGIAIGVLGQLGDLSESLIKRDCQVKDSGNWIPGMGGILDEIDSLLFSAPAFYFYINIAIR